jgi:hypothetical protein
MTLDLGGASSNAHDHLVYHSGCSLANQGRRHEREERVRPSDCARYTRSAMSMPKSEIQSRPTSRMSGVDIT